MRLQLLNCGTAGIPSEHLRREKSPVSLVVSPDKPDIAISALEFLKGCRDGDIFLLAPDGCEFPGQICDPNCLILDSRDITVFVVGDQRKPLPDDVIAYLFKLRLRQVLSLSPDMDLSEYSRPRSCERELLFVSPGSIFPLSMGSHQRMFNTIIGLIDNDIDVTVLAQEQKPGKKVATEAALRLVATSVHFYKASHGKIRGITWWQRRLFDLLKKVLRVEIKRAPSFSERTQQRSSFWMGKELKSLAGTGKYSALWVNYAWMMGQITPELRRAFRVVVCDTHDVQFYRNATGRHWLEKLIFVRWLDRNAELALLKRADVIVAISDRDGAILKEVLPGSVICTMPPSFNHFKTEVVAHGPYKPLTFGFIGTNMAANTQALRYITSEWWPSIHRYSPDSVFLVAGNVCEDQEIKKSAWLHDEIRLLGFVDDLHKFYQDIDVLLSPVLVKGGLNFKNAEAVVAGKHIITNAAGAEVLHPVPVKVAESAEGVIQILREIEDDPQRDVGVRVSAQAAALARFGWLDMEPIVSKIEEGRGNAI